MKLISLPLSPYSARVRVSLYAKELPVELERPPAGWMASRALRPLNPLARLPILVLDDGATVAESSVILDYLEETAPQRPLLPSDPRERARVRYLAEVAVGYVLGATMPLFGGYAAAEQAAEGTGAAAIAPLMERLQASLEVLESLLPDGPYAHGDRLTLADAALAPTRFVLGSLGDHTRQPGLLDACPRLRAYADRARRDPTLGRVWHEMTEGLTAFMAAGSS